MKDKELHCHYSGLPSPSAYTNQEPKNNKHTAMKRFLQKMLLWWSYKRISKPRKNIWDL